MNEYQQQALDFLKACNATMEIEFQCIDVNQNWNDDEKRAKYRFTIKTPRGQMSGDFWDSIFHTKIILMTLEEYCIKEKRKRLEWLTSSEKAKLKIELKEGKAKAIILKGKDFTGKEKQLAMTIYDGWDSLAYVESTGTNPDSEKSIIAYAKADFEKQYDGHAPYVMISQVITKESHEDFAKEEIFPIQEIKYEDEKGNGAYGTTTIILKNGTVKTVNFEGIESRLSL